jgi:hypothetical protein
MKQNFITEKRQAIQDDIAQQKKTIEEANEEIEIKLKQDEELIDLEKRLQRLSTIRYFENIADADKVAALTNVVRLRDLIEKLEKLGIVQANWQPETIFLGDLSTWQTMFLLFGDQPKKSVAIEPGGIKGDGTKSLYGRESGE